MYRPARFIFLRKGGHRLQVYIFIFVYSYATHRNVQFRRKPSVYCAYKLVNTAFNRDGHNIIQF